MLLFAERGLRVANNRVGELRHVTAINPHLKTFPESQMTTFGAFCDVTPFNAVTMHRLIPQGNYRWNSDIILKQTRETPESSNKGYFSR